MGQIPSARTPFAASLEIRYVGALGGRYSFPPAVATDAQSSVYACRTMSVSPSSILLAAPVAGAIGQSVVLLLDHIGPVRGVVSRLATGGFHIAVEGTRADQEKLAARINWLKSHRLRRALDKREAPRRLPKSPSAYFYLADGTENACFLVDVSAAGAGVSAELRPPIGTKLVLGSLAGLVVRHMETGFGVEFAKPSTPELLEPSLKARRGGGSSPST